MKNGYLFLGTSLDGTLMGAEALASLTDGGDITLGELKSIATRNAVKSNGRVMVLKVIGYADPPSPPPDNYTEVK